MIKKVFEILYYVFLTATIFVLLGLSIDANKSLACKEFTVYVDHSCGNFFVDAGQIETEVYKVFDTLVGQQVSKIELNEVEKLISELNFVKSAEVYRTIDGRIKADVKQQKPLLRIINSMGQSFYIDTDGKFMPLSREYTARVMVVTGYVNSEYSPLLSLKELNNNETISHDEKVLKDIYDLAVYISNQPLLAALIDHIVVSPDMEYELIPKNGMHIIEFGGIDRMNQKFYKLLMFYKHGLTNLGWSKYNRINLKYKNQVVCVN